MATTNFTPKTGSIDASWLNDVDQVVYDVLTPEMYGAKGDGTTDDTTALEKAVTAVSVGGTLNLGDNTYAVSSVFDITRPDITITGQGAEIKATASLSGDSACISVAGQSNVNFAGKIMFNANGNRKHGLLIQSDCTNCSAIGVDAKFFTDNDGLGIKVSEDTVVELTKTRRFLIPIRASSGAVAGGSLVDDTYKITACAVDALGREGPALVPSSAVGNTTSGSNNAVDFLWKPVPDARSYRVYAYQTSESIADYKLFYAKPLTSADTGTLSINIAGEYGDNQSTCAVAKVTGQPAGTFTDNLGLTYFFRIAAIYANGLSNHSFNLVNLIAFTTINFDTEIARITWSAPAYDGTAPSGYRLFISTQDTGGLRNWERSIDVGNVLTYDFTGQAGYKTYPYGNADEVPAEGFRERNFGGSAKAILNGETQQVHSVPGTDNSYQLGCVNTSTGSTPNGVGIPFFGYDWRLKTSVDTVQRRYWAVGMWGDGTDYAIVSPYPSNNIVLRYKTNGNIQHVIGHYLKSTESGITASTGSIQGGSPLTKDINEISVCANAGDSATLPTGVVGMSVTVINNGANAADVFPASGDNIGAGLNTAVSLLAGVSIKYECYKLLNWIAV